MAVSLLIATAIIAAAGVGVARLVFRVRLAGLVAGVALVLGGALVCDRGRHPGIRRVGLGVILAGAVALILFALAFLFPQPGDSSVPLFPFGSW
jgi:hypothetical protein